MADENVSAGAVRALDAARRDASKVLFYCCLLRLGPKLFPIPQPYYISVSGNAIIIFRVSVRDSVHV